MTVNAPDLRALDDQLVDHAARFACDPLGFVRFAFPWGQPGELLNADGPRAWQADVLADVGTRLRAGHAPGAALHPVLKAISSGHGIGKSALLGWLVNWALATCVDAKVLITAGTEAQVRTKLWPEVCRWMRLSIFQHWFRVFGTSILSSDPAHDRTWRCDAVTWSETNTEAFQGLHNQGRRIVLIFDEASGIDDRIWTVAEGALTDEDTEIVWLATSNPTKPTGRFAECFGRQRARWHGVQIDSRTVPGTNKALFAEWIDLYGLDSDFVKVRILGQFPAAGSMQFIGADLVEAACQREAKAQLSDPLIIGVDVARFGDDQSVIAFRKGRDARTHLPIRLRGVDTMTLAGRVAEEYDNFRADAVFVDGGGGGGGVVDRLRQLGVPVIEVQFGGKADGATHTEERHAYGNKRSEIWGHLREWLKVGAIPDDPELRADLAGPQYAFAMRDGKDVIMLEPKPAMKARGLASPDWADALALTFAYPTMPRLDAGRFGAGGGQRVVSEYNPYDADGPDGLAAVAARAAGVARPPLYLGSGANDRRPGGAYMAPAIDPPGMPWNTPGRPRWPL